MDNKPPFDRDLIFPLVLGALSIFGIVVILLIGRALNAPAQVAATPSATPFQYLYLGTEPAVLTPLTEPSEIFSPGEELPPETPAFSFPTAETPIIFPPGNETQILLSPTRPSGRTPLVLPTLDLTSTTPAPGLPTSSVPSPTSVSGPPLNAGTYDDIYEGFVYSGTWAPTTINGNTLRVSSVPGSTISFRFIGREMRLFYQGGSTLGEMRIAIDNQSETLDQSAGTEWVSETFPNQTHSVLITHVGGGSVNIDYVIIPAVGNTATPSATPTATQGP